MPKRIPKIALTIASLVLLWLILAFAGYRPGYFANVSSIEGLLFVELLLATVWQFRRFFFATIVLSFVLAGINLPFAGAWTMGRWAVLVTGALVGCILLLREPRLRFNSFHFLGFFAVLTALVSAAVSSSSTVSLLKALSLFLLLIYASTGARLAVLDRENEFFAGLLIGCEVLVALIALMYLIQIQVMGNSNSLGAVMGVVFAPVLLWGTLVSSTAFAYWRRTAFYTVSIILTFLSHSRAGILTALLSSTMLCLALRKYGPLLRLTLFLVIAAAGTAVFRPQVFSNATDSFWTDVVLKAPDPHARLFASRESPWQDTISSINEHFWFGTGFGTSRTDRDSSADPKLFESGTTSVEHGSSYLAILLWVGMVGILPFVLLIAALLRMIFDSVIWMYRTANPAYGFVPLAMILMGGLVHAAFEDWLFAPGYYLCVFFWSVAFILADELRGIRACTRTIRMPDSRPTVTSHWAFRTIKSER